MAIIGHQHIINYLKKSVKKNKISHAYLFEGPEKIGKKELALWFAGLLECKRPDITEISLSENKKEIGIGQIQDLRRYLSLSPHSSPYKIAIVDKAEKMTVEAANALLKTLEEPRGNAVLILISSIPSALPETILSRCEEIKFKPGSLDKISAEFIKKEYVDILQWPLKDAFRYIEKLSKNNSGETTNLLNGWLFWFRDLLIQSKKTRYSREQVVKLIKEIQKTKNLISTTNINQRLALENLILCINSY